MVLDNAPVIMRKSAFAKLLGISPSAIAYAVASGSVSLTRDKMINTRNPKNIRYALECRARKEKTAKGQDEEKKKIAKSAAVNSDLVESVTKIRQAEADLVETFEAEDNLKADYQIAKLQAQTKSLEIKNAVAVRNLIKREFVNAAIGRIASVLSNHLLTMGDRISADCAAVCGALTPENKIAVKQLIDKDTTRSINALKMEIKKEYEDKVDKDE